MKNNAVTPPAALELTTRQIWEAFSERLFAFIRKQVSEEEVAQDILQDVFEKIHLKKSSLKDSQKLESWLFQLTRNIIIDYYRNQKSNGREFPDIGFDEEDDVSMPDSLICCIAPFLSRLHPDERELIQKIDLNGNSQKEMAADMGIPYASLKSKVQRARVKLKELFVQCCVLEFNRRGGIVEIGENSNCGKC